jgi:hypothetical protein
VAEDVFQLSLFPYADGGTLYRALSDFASYKIKASRDLPIFHAYNLSQSFCFALVVSVDRRISVDKIKSDSGLDNEYTLSSPNQFNNNSTSFSMLSDCKEASIACVL